MNDPIAYAPARPRRWRTLRLVLLIIVVSGAALWVGGRLFRWISHRSIMLEMQDEVKQFQAPGGTVVYVDGPERDELTFSGGPYHDVPGGWQRDEGYRGRTVQSIETIQQQAVRQRRRIPTVALFVGARTTAAGDAALVGVLLECNRIQQRSALSTSLPSAITCAVVATKPISLLGRGAWSATPATTTLGSWPSTGTDVTFFAGQPDPADASRFTIAYEIGDGRGVIDGVLNDDLTVTLSPRTGPLAATTP
jgi:hypothetical protein